MFLQSLCLLLASVFKQVQQHEAVWCSLTVDDDVEQNSDVVGAVRDGYIECKCRLFWKEKTASFDKDIPAGAVDVPHSIS